MCVYVCVCMCVVRACVRACVRASFKWWYYDDGAMARTELLVVPFIPLSLFILYSEALIRCGCVVAISVHICWLLGSEALI